MHPLFWQSQRARYHHAGEIPQRATRDGYPPALRSRERAVEERVALDRIYPDPHLPLFN
jgi:hypothetical protein